MLFWYLVQKGEGQRLESDNFFTDPILRTYSTYQLYILCGFSTFSLDEDSSLIHQIKQSIINSTFIFASCNFIFAFSYRIFRQKINRF